MPTASAGTCRPEVRPRYRWGAPALAVAVGLTVVLAAGPGRGATPVALAPEELHRGDPAVVRTAFEGDSVEEFPAEIVGVVAGGRVDGEIILARATSERLERLGVAQGMSGSPVFVNGKLVGALSSSWPFEREPLFGITPIRQMLRLLDYPERVDSEVSAGPGGLDMAGPVEDVHFGEFCWGEETGGGRADDGRAGLAPAGTAEAAVPLPIPVACGGLAPPAFETARAWLAAFGLNAVPGGVAADGGPEAASLVPGSPVAVEFMRGDLQLSAIGTLTWRDGDRVVCFGHPVFQSGEVRLPLATARITGVISSAYVSFKVGSRGREVGLVTQDRRAGVAGQIGRRARMLPVSVRVEGAGRTMRSFWFEMIEDRGMAPQMAGLATLNSLLESGGTGPNQTLWWSLTLHRRGVPPLTMRDVTVGEQPASEMAGAVSSPLAFLFGNPFERLSLDSIEVAVRVSPGRAQWTLRGARLLADAVRPGGVARVECQIEPWRGARETRIVEVPVAQELPEGRYSLWVGGGAELSRFEAARLPDRYRPTSLDDAWARLGRLRSSSAIHAVILASAPDVTRDGRDYPELPGSAAAVLSSRLAAGDGARRSEAALLGETRLPLAGLVRGEFQLPLIVDTKAP